jgi:receptor protein-tyrosine kinase
VRSDDELSEILGRPVLARVALARNRRARVLNEEAYRVLRTNLEFVRPDRPLRTVTVVSPSAGEGKTSTVLNLGRAMSEIGDRILLVEGDMRRPALQKALIPDLEEPLRPGLSNVLSGAAEVGDAIHPTDDRNIFIVPAGPVPPAPSALLDGERGHKFLKLLEAEFDVVIVDTPPLAVGADAALLAADSDETIMVIDTKSSSVKAITNAVNALALVKAPLAGAVVNRVRDSANESYAYGYTDVPKDKRLRFGFWRAQRTSQVEDGASPEALPRETLATRQDDH